MLIREKKSGNGSEVGLDFMTSKFLFCLMTITYGLASYMY